MKTGSIEARVETLNPHLEGKTALRNVPDCLGETSQLREELAAQRSYVIWVSLVFTFITSWALRLKTSTLQHDV